MPVTSPRTDFRGTFPAPIDWADQREHLSLLARAIRQLQESFRRHPIEVVTVTANYTMVDIDALILGNAASGSLTVTLLTAAGREGRRIAVKKTDSSINTVTIDAAGSETLDGATTVVLTQQNAVRDYISDGTNWRLLSAIGNATGL